MRNYQEMLGLDRIVNNSDLEAMFSAALKQQLLSNCLGTLPVARDNLIMSSSTPLRSGNLSCDAS